MSIFRALKKANGLGSGGNGTHHFIVQRISAIILIPLALYFLIAVVALVRADGYVDVTNFFNNPFNSGLALAFVLTGYYHAALGVQVVLEDYVHTQNTKILALIAVNGVCVIGAAVAVVSILRLALA